MVSRIRSVAGSTLLDPAVGARYRAITTSPSGSRV